MNWHGVKVFITGAKAPIRSISIPLQVPQIPEIIGRAILMAEQSSEKETPK